MVRTRKGRAVWSPLTTLGRRRLERQTEEGRRLCQTYIDIARRSQRSRGSAYGSRLVHLYGRVETPGPLANTYRGAPVQMDGASFVSAEAAYWYRVARHFGRSELLNALSSPHLTERDTTVYAQLLRSQEEYQEEWLAHGRARRDLQEILRRKAEQNAHVRETLLATGDKFLVETSGDLDFGSYANYYALSRLRYDDDVIYAGQTGPNWNGIYWMHIREQLRVRPGVPLIGRGSVPSNVYRMGLSPRAPMTEPMCRRPRYVGECLAVVPYDPKAALFAIVANEVLMAGPLLATPRDSTPARKRRTDVEDSPERPADKAARTSAPESPGQENVSPRRSPAEANLAPAVRSPPRRLDLIEGLVLPSKAPTTPVSRAYRGMPYRMFSAIEVTADELSPPAP